MPFGLSGSRSRTRSTGSSFSFGQSTQEARSGSVSGGVSRGRESARSTQAIAFEDVFARLFGGAEQAAAGLDPSLLVDASNQLFAGGTDFLAGLGGDVGTDYLTSRLEGADQLTGEQIQLLQEDVGRLFEEELLPGVTSEAIAGGQLGGGRQGVAQQGAIREASEAFRRGAVDIRTRNQAQLDELAAGVAARDIQGAQVGLAGLPGLAGIVEMGFGAELAPMERLAALLGGPTVLTESESAGMQDAMDFARAFSRSFGQSTDMSRSRTESTSSSRSFGLGF